MARVRPGIGIAAAAVIAVATAVGPALAAEERVADRVFLVKDKPGTPTQFQMVVLAGCGDEANGQCRGIAHYLEHLVLVGRNPEHNTIAIRFFPDASSNGWTSARATAYVHSIPAREAGPAADLEKLFAFYAARLKDFSITEDEAARERNVVLQEHDWRVGSNPFRRFQRQIDRELMPNHPSGQWTIGTREDIERFTLEEAKAFHHRWYVINNVYFAVKADIEAKDLEAIAARALAGLDAKPLPPRSARRQPEIANVRKDMRHADVQVKRASVSYKKLVRMENGDAISQRAARALLMSFLSSRLPGSPYQALVEKSQLANGHPHVSINRAAPRSFVLSISADVAPDVDPAALLTAIGTYVDGVGNVALTTETLDRLKRRFAEGRANSDKDPEQVYRRLVSWLANRNPYQEYRVWPDKIAAVTAADIASVATALAGPGKIVTGTIVPAEAAAK